MNTFQEFFTFFYAVYFAIMAVTSGKLQSFDTPVICTLRYGRAWLRAGVSLLILNIGPAYYYYFVFSRLERFDGYHINFCYLLLIFFLSLASLGFYRIHYGLMLVKQKDKYFFYDFELYNSELDSNKKKGIPCSLGEDLEKRPLVHENAWLHIGPGLFWIIVSFGLAWVLIK